MKNLKNILKLAMIPILAGGLYGIYKLNNSPKENKENKKNIIPITSKSWTTQGKFERTYRYDDILDKVEEKRGIEKGLLKALAMIEGCGDPLRLNESGDGGAGLFMFQPGTAKYCGLNIYGNSNRMGIARSHGRELKKLTHKHKNNYSELAKIDERFDVYKSSDAAGKFLKQLYNKNDYSWDKALSAYNRGTPARNCSSTNHVKVTRKYQNYYNKRDKD